MRPLEEIQAPQALPEEIRQAEEQRAELLAAISEIRTLRRTHLEELQEAQDRAGRDGDPERALLY